MPVDSQTLGELLDRYWPILIAWIGGERVEAEDIVQQSFIKLALAEPIPDNCPAWLFTTSRRLAINQQIARKKQRIRERAVAGLHQQAQAGSQLALFEIHDLLDRLEVTEREVVIAKVWGGLTLDEIALALGVSTATVCRRYQAGIARLKELMGEG